MNRKDQIARLGQKLLLNFLFCMFLSIVFNAESMRRATVVILTQILRVIQ